MLNVNRTFTPSEAAVASGVPLKTVHREIDQGPLTRISIFQVYY